MLPPSLIREVIALNAQEGGIGLYEVIWDLNTRVPSEPESAKIQACMPILTEFIALGWVELYRERWATPLEQSVPTGSALEAAADARSWAPPSDADPWYYCFVITEAGQLAHLQGLI